MQNNKKNEDIRVGSSPLVYGLCTDRRRCDGGHIYVTIRMVCLMEICPFFCVICFFGLGLPSSCSCLFYVKRGSIYVYHHEGLLSLLYIG